MKQNFSRFIRNFIEPLESLTNVNKIKYCTFLTCGIRHKANMEVLHYKKPSNSFEKKKISPVQFAINDCNKWACFVFLKYEEKIWYYCCVKTWEMVLLFIALFESTTYINAYNTWVYAYVREQEEQTLSRIRS